MTLRYETLRRRALLAEPTLWEEPGLDLLVRRGLPAWVASQAPAPKARALPAIPRLLPAGAAPRRPTAIALLLSAMVLAQHKEEDP
jgi:hypothetical protein